MEPTKCCETGCIVTIVLIQIERKTGHGLLIKTVSNNTITKIVM